MPFAEGLTEWLTHAHRVALLPEDAPQPEMSVEATAAATLVAQVLELHHRWLESKFKK